MFDCDDAPRTIATQCPGWNLRPPPRFTARVFVINVSVVIAGSVASNDSVAVIGAIDVVIAALALAGAPAVSAEDATVVAAVAALSADEAVSAVSDGTVVVCALCAD